MTTDKVCSDCGTNLATESESGTCPQCQTEPRTPTAGVTLDSPGAGVTCDFLPSEMARLMGLLPSLELLEEIGRGGMGVVYKARHVKMDRVVALKLIRPDWDRDPAFAERFTREARAMARLNHPNIITIYDFGEAEGLYYLVMELVEGENLRERLKTGRLEEKQAYDLMTQVCEGLDYAHHRGVVHRDVKPENILIDRRGLAKLADFGLAKLLDPGVSHLSLTRTRQVLGTPRYMAPEQFEGAKEVDHRVDLYSVGVVLYEMLVGVTPVGRFELPSKARPGIHEKADQVVLRALQHDPIHRYTRASDLKNDLADCIVPTLSRMTDRITAPAVDLEAVRVLLKWPSRGIAIAGLINYAFLFIIITIEPSLVSGPSFFRASSITYAAIGMVMLFGSYSLSSLRARWLGLFAGVVAILPLSPGSLLGGAVFGIWSLAVLCRRDVIEAFRINLQSIDPPISRKVPKVAAGDLEAVRRDLKWPARALIAVGVLNGLTLPVGVVLFVIATEVRFSESPFGVFLPNSGTSPAASLSKSFTLWFMIASILGIPLLLGGLRMRSLDHRTLALSACILAILPITPVAVLGGFIVGIWALAVMTRPDVRAAFAARAQGDLNESISIP